MNTHAQALNDDWAGRISEGAVKYGIPGRMVGGLIRYVQHRTLPGSFLTAVLESDLRRAVHSADEENLELLPQYVRWLTNCVPADSWGSRAAVAAWLERTE